MTAAILLAYTSRSQQLGQASGLPVLDTSIQLLIHAVSRHKNAVVKLALHARRHYQVAVHCVRCATPVDNAIIALQSVASQHHLSHLKCVGWRAMWGTWRRGNLQRCRKRPCAACPEGAPPSAAATAAGAAAVAAQCIPYIRPSSCHQQQLPRCCCIGGQRPASSNGKHLGGRRQRLACGRRARSRHLLQLSPITRHCVGWRTAAGVQCWQPFWCWDVLAGSADTGAGGAKAGAVSDTFS